MALHAFARKSYHRSEVPLSVERDAILAYMTDLHEHVRNAEHPERQSHAGNNR